MMVLAAERQPHMNNRSCPESHFPVLFIYWGALRLACTLDSSPVRYEFKQRIVSQSSDQDQKPKLALNVTD